jgi:hypothetical protein
MATCETPHHPEVGNGGEVMAINGPLCQPTSAVDSLEWAEQPRKPRWLCDTIGGFGAGHWHRRSAMAGVRK